MLGINLAFILLLQAGAQGTQTGVVAGQLRNVEGAPAVAIRVSVIPAPTGTIRPSDAGEYYFRQPAVSTALTDNQGRYRLTNVPPGRYLLVSGITYYPTTLDPDRASIITVGPNATTDNLDFRLMRPVGGRVSGHIKPRPAEVVKAVLSGPRLEEILEVPIGADGAFEFGHVPQGTYVIDILPPPPGMGPYRLAVGDKDVTGVELVPPPTHVVTGRIIVQSGPLPHALLAFAAAKSYVSSPINADGTFTARLHSARHEVVLAGMPVGYSVSSVREGAKDVSQGITVGNADVSGIVITVTAPRTLPHLRGRVMGLPEARLAATKVQIAGPIIGSIETPIRPDGSFEFAAVTPGLYRLTLTQVPELRPMNVVVTPTDANVEVAVPSGR